MILLLTLGLGAGIFLYLNLRKTVKEGTCSGCRLKCKCQEGAESKCH